MSAKKPNADKGQKIEAYIDHVEAIIDFQANNGLLTKSEAEGLQKQLDDASTKLADDLFAANGSARRTFFDLVEKVNSKPRRARLLYMYGLHIWVFLVSLVGVLFILLLLQTLNFSIFGGIPMDVIIWGGLGATAYSIFHLRKIVFEFQLS